MTAEVVLRAIDAADEPFLQEMLIVAFNFDGTERTPVEDLVAKEVPKYVTAWGRNGDHGLIAELDGAPVGAAWARLFPESADTYGFVAPDVPELVCIGLRPAAQGKGVGGLLFDTLVRQLEELGYRAVSLSVDDGNDKAKAMYERRRFRVVGRKGDAEIMRREFEKSM